MRNSQLEDPRVLASPKPMKEPCFPVNSIGILPSSDAEDNESSPAPAEVKMILVPPP